MRTRRVGTLWIFAARSVRLGTRRTLCGGDEMSKFALIAPEATVPASARAQVHILQQSHLYGRCATASAELCMQIVVRFRSIGVLPTSGFSTH
jgi:hypothetical protein